MICCKGIIQESISPWCSSVVLVKTKNGEMKFCIDYRAINRISKLDSFPMLLVVETLDALSGTQYFSTLDLKSGYWQIEMDPLSRGKTSFVTHNDLYEFLVMPFGLRNSGASFTRLMSHILRDLEYRFALIYTDDIEVKDVFSVSDTGILGNRNFRVLPTGVEPTTFRLVFRMLYH